MPWVKKIDAQRALAGILRADATAAAGSNDYVNKRTERKKLNPFMQRVDAQMREDGGRGTRVKVNELMDEAMGEAMGTWAEFNPKGNGRDSKYLSHAEVADIKKADKALGILTEQARARAASTTEVKAPTAGADDRWLEVTMTTDHPGATLTREGNLYRLTTDNTGAEATLGHQPKVTLRFDGKSVDILAGRSGAVSLWQLDKRMPEGYWATVDKIQFGSPATATFKIEKVHPDALSDGELLVKAREALETYVKEDRRFHEDWNGSMTVPETWDEMVAGGVLDQIAKFGAPPDQGRNDYYENAVYPNGERITFAGTGPFYLYTEMTMNRVDGSLVKAYVEID